MFASLDKKQLLNKKFSYHFQSHDRFKFLRKNDVIRFKLYI